VFEARDQLLGRTVAIKKHRPDRLPEGWSRNLLAEARKLASIDHPHIVRVYDVVEDSGEILIVSAYIDGSDLNLRLLRGRMPLEEGLSIVAGIAEALHHIHLRGLVHRDVKPANILVDGQNRPYLSDFGLAASEEELLREQPGVQGTYAYMSPEQVRGDSHLVDSRTDVYGLGVVLYEVLTGRVPFVATNPGEYREQILSRPPRPPRTIDDTIPQELERVCLKCLAKSVEDRYTTAGDLASDLRAWLNREPEPPLVPAPTPARPWKGVAAGAGAFLCLGLALLVAYWIWPEKPQPQPSVGDPGKKARAALQPGVWYDLLEEEPTVVFHPERFARVFDPAKKELWWDTRGDCLIRLGSTRSDDYEIEATFEQTQLAGHRGLFFGRPPLKGEKPNFTQCQAIVLAIDSLRQQEVALSRATLTVNEAAGKFHQMLRHGARVLLPRAAPTQLKLSVRVMRGRLAWVRVNNEEVGGLIPDKHPPAPGEPVLVGDFGVFSGTGACRLPKARFKIHRSED
jgi:hypothetical protein